MDFYNYPTFAPEPEIIRWKTLTSLILTSEKFHTLFFFPGFHHICSKTLWNGNKLTRAATFLSLKTPTGVGFFLVMHKGWKHVFLSLFSPETNKTFGHCTFQNNLIIIYDMKWMRLNASLSFIQKFFHLFNVNGLIMTRGYLVHKVYEIKNRHMYLLIVYP